MISKEINNTEKKMAIHLFFHVTSTVINYKIDKLNLKIVILVL